MKTRSIGILFPIERLSDHSGDLSSSSCTVKQGDVALTDWDIDNWYDIWAIT